ncbi:MAG: hypothetical protein K9M07_02345 [Simkaniaceae bacterium]|nr:hypothetical protein [Simkaniaceae bacterium]MCF7852062.1 hypothetical protein [Simkaniaceae bacterium]
MIGCIVNYCTNDFRYLKFCIEALQPLFSPILIPVCDHFFDGTPENRDLLNRSYREYPNVRFIEFAFNEKPYGLPQTFEDPTKMIHFWHSTARYVGYHFLQSECEYVLFLDVDEIIDTSRFKLWLDAFDYRAYNAIRFDSFFYFMKPTKRAMTYL